jgi:hypothetical protein
MLEKLFLVAERTVQRLPHDTIFACKSEAQVCASEGICVDIRTHSRPSWMFVRAVSFAPG